MVEIQLVDIMVAGTALRSDVLDGLRECRVSRTLNAPAQLTLRFSDDDLKMAANSTLRLGKDVTVSVSDPTSGKLEPIFEGEIVGVGTDMSASDRFEFVVTAYDRAHRMSLDVSYTTFIHRSTGDVLKELAEACDLAFNSDELMESRLWSTTSSPLALIEDITTHLGLCWTVEDGKLQVFTPRVGRTAPIELPHGRSSAGIPGLLRFSAHASAIGAGTEVQVIGWDRDSANAVEGSAPPAPAPFAEISLDIPSAPFGNHKVVVSADRSPSAQDAKERASALRSMLARDAITARGETIQVFPQLVPGATLKVPALGAFSGSYLLTEVEHLIANNQHRTRFRCGAPPHAPRAASRPSAGAYPMIGIVTAHWDPSTDEPGEETRVKVRLPAMGEQYETTWAPVISPLAGGNTGLVTVPDVDDQVVVVFEGGNLDRPLVIGSMWTTGKKAEFGVKAQGGKGHEYRFTTRWGAEIKLVEKSESEDEVTITSKDAKSAISMTPTLLKLTSNAKETIEVSTGKASMVFNKGQDVTIKGENITIDAAQNFKVSSKAGASIETNGALALKGSQAKVEGQSVAELSASGMAVVKGGMVKIN